MLSDFRRFVSYLYRYKNGKKEKNSGFAKVEVRNGILKINIQLESAENGQEGLDVYGFVRKGEKQTGVYLGAMQTGRLPWFQLAVKNEQLGGTPYRLENFAGLWVKGAKGENHITVWDEEPMVTMELESEILEKTEETEHEEERTEEKEEEEGRVRAAEEAPVLLMSEIQEEPEQEAEEVSDRENPSENIVSEILQEGEQYGVWKVVLESEPEKEEPEKSLNGVRALESADLAGTVKTLERPLTENEHRWEQLLNRYGHRDSLLKEEEVDCICMTPRELSMFQSKEWNPCKNNFIFYGYYHYRHLIFGRFPDGVCFLGVPGMFSPREQRTAQAFGFPCFYEGKEQKRGGRFGYWCRPVE